MELFCLCGGGHAFVLRSAALTTQAGGKLVDVWGKLYLFLKQGVDHGSRQLSPDVSHLPVKSDAFITGFHLHSCLFNTGTWGSTMQGHGAGARGVIMNERDNIFVLMELTVR